MILNILGTKTKQIKEIRDLQRRNIGNKTDEYMIGLYNGLEFATAMLENREPIFETCIKEPEIKETKEQKGRTVASGIRIKPK